MYQQRTVWAVLLAVVVSFGAEAEQQTPATEAAKIGAGWMAHQVCSGVFVSGRTVESVMGAEFGPGADPALRALEPVLDTARHRVTVTVPGVTVATAVYRDGLGCTLAHSEGSADALQGENIPGLSGLADASRPWPHGMGIRRDVEGVDYSKLDAAVSRAVAHGKGLAGRGTRAVAVVHKGRLVAEGYAAGFDAAMPVYSASMSKTVTGMLVGILVGQGKLKLDQRNLRAEWAGDSRRDITVDDLMKMISGLEFGEEYAAASHVNIMLMNESDMAAYAASHRALVRPGIRWAYSSGTTNIIMDAAKRTFGSGDAWLDFPRASLFEPIGLRHTVFETDASGTFVGSSFVWSTAQDYARLALLLLQDGVWDGRRVLPSGWVDYMATPADGNDYGNYGAQTWLWKNAMPGEASREIYMSGYGGQLVVVLRDEATAIVRFGWDFDAPAFTMRGFVDEVRAALGNKPAN